MAASPSSETVGKSKFIVSKLSFICVVVVRILTGNRRVARRLIVIDILVTKVLDFEMEVV